jgi:hypothetical protein
VFAAAALLGVAAVTACYVPIRRASSLQDMREKIQI